MEIKEDRRQRAEQEERDCQRKEKGNGRAVEEILEARPSQPWKQKVRIAEEGPVAKKL